MPENLLHQNRELNPLCPGMSLASDFLERSKPNFVHPVSIFVEDEMYGCESGIDFIDSVVESLKTESPSLTMKTLKNAASEAKEALTQFGKWLSLEVLPRATMNYQLEKNTWNNFFPKEDSVSLWRKYGSLEETNSKD